MDSSLWSVMLSGYQKVWCLCPIALPRHAIKQHGVMVKKMTAGNIDFAALPAVASASLSVIWVHAWLVHDSLEYRTEIKVRKDHSLWEPLGKIVFWNGAAPRVEKENTDKIPVFHIRTAFINLRRYIGQNGFLALHFLRNRGFYRWFLGGFFCLFFFSTVLSGLPLQNQAGFDLKGLPVHDFPVPIEHRKPCHESSAWGDNP